MLFYVLILATFFTQGISDEELSMVEMMGDLIISKFAPFGEPFTEDLEQIKKLYCQTLSQDFLTKQKDRVKLIMKGSFLSFTESLISAFDIKDVIICKLFEKGENEKVLNIIKVYNKAVDVHKKLRQQMTAVLDEAALKDTNTTFPLLACYFKVVFKEFLASLPEEDGVREFAANFVGIIFQVLIKEIEKNHGKANENCHLPDLKPVETEYKTLLVPIARAYHNLDKN